MNERDINYIKNMLMFAERVRTRIEQISIDEFISDIDKQDLILYPLGQIGENAGNVSDEARDKYHDIHWNPIIGIRNRIFHSYEDIDMRMVYNAAFQHIPELISQLNHIVNSSKVRFE
jgi:uncharacterized protein with HEPN domain